MMKILQTRTPNHRQKLSCTTTGVYVVQDDRAFNPLERLKPILIEGISLRQADRTYLYFVSQDWDLPVLRWGKPIAYRGGNSAIGFTELDLSCTTNGIYVVQDKGGYNAS